METAGTEICSYKPLTFEDFAFIRLIKPKIMQSNLTLGYKCLNLSR
jgi:hypothetical protein